MSMTLEMTLKFSIPNCGKGQPMQVMRVGNGGPTLRSEARLTGIGDCVS